MVRNSSENAAQRYRLFIALVWVCASVAEVWSCFRWIVSHPTTGLWANNWNLMKILFDLNMVLIGHILAHVTTVSCRDMCKIVTRFDSYLSSKNNMIASRFELWAHKSFVERLADVTCCMYGYITTVYLMKHAYSFTPCFLVVTALILTGLTWSIHPYW